MRQGKAQIDDHTALIVASSLAIIITMTLAEELGLGCGMIANNNNRPFCRAS
jgi:hypothetical protein